MTKKKASKTKSKKVAAKKTVAARPTARSRKKASTSSTTKKKVAKKRSARKKVVRKKPTKKERAARRPQNRKPATNGSRRSEIVELFPCATSVGKMTPEQKLELQQTFCRTLATRGIVRDACIAAGISRKTYVRWRKGDDNFREACEMAEEMAADVIEKEAIRRAVEGYEHPVIYQGEITGTYTEYSDSLMAMLLKGNRKDKYKERTEHSGSIAKPTTLDKESKQDVIAGILGFINSKQDPD